ncbi:fibronectin type III domain-containing protein [Micromonospora sp. NPDC023814]|uniref:fibronectin type III domain-containing protein n=1 Tax=Micromonospora sp. NPDC023814 TaxID=3154596 RepID=UPI0033EA377C
MALEQGMVIAVAEWLPNGNEWWANFQVTLTNYTDEDTIDPKIAFSFTDAHHIVNNYGLVFTPSESPVRTIEGVLVAEKKIIPAHGSQSFTLAMQNGGVGAGEDPKLLPQTFTVDGHSADPPADDEPPTTPRQVRALAAAAHSLSLEWDPSTDNLAVAGYEITFHPADGPTATITTPRPNATVSGLAPSTTYTFQVRAYDISRNYSGYSESFTASTTEPLPDPGDWDAPRAPFVDYTAWPNPQLTEYANESGIDGFFTGFLVAKPGGDKKVYWGGYDSLGDATTSTHGKDDIAAFAARHGKTILSFGGASNVPLEEEETDVVKIAATYEAILANYNVNHLDFDFEGGFIHNDAGQDRHVAAISQVLQAHPSLKVSYTLPVDGAPGSLIGFNDGGVRLLHRLARAGIQPSLINGMLMEFGQTSPPDAYECCVIALNGMFTQISAAWPDWAPAKVWRRIGACPMFGRHINGKIFTLHNMRQLVEFAQERHLGCLSGWDATRDRNQGTLPECADLSGNDLAKCTYVEQQAYEFSKIIATYRPDDPA